MRAYGKARLGYVNVLGDEDDGRNADERVPAAGARVLVVDAACRSGRFGSTTPYDEPRWRFLASSAALTSA